MSTIRGPVGDIPIDLTGVLNWFTFGQWATFRGCQTLLDAAGAVVGGPQVYDLGPVTSWLFDEGDDGWNVLAGDSLRVRLGNGSGAVQTLSSMTFFARVEGTLQTREDVAPTDPYLWYPFDASPIEDPEWTADTSDEATTAGVGAATRRDGRASAQGRVGPVGGGAVGRRIGRWWWFDGAAGGR